MLANSGALRLFKSSARRVRAVARLATYGTDTEMSLAGALARWAERQPERPCLWFEGRNLSYAEVAGAVERRAAAFWEGGVRKGDTVALMMTNRPEFVVNALALERIGSVPALINTQLRGSGLRHAVLIAKPMAVVAGGGMSATVHEALAEDLTGSAPALWADWADSPAAEGSPFRDLRELEGNAKGAPALVDARGGDLMAYIYTSGTTGLPKAGKVLHARVVMAAEGFGTIAMGLLPGDVFFNCLPMFHSNGFIIAMGGALWTGATLALSRRFSASHFWGEVRACGATAFIYIGEICRYLLNQPPSPLDGQHSVRCIIGNGLRPEVWDEFVSRFKPGKVFEFYGATEGNVNMINLRGRPGSVGKIPKPLDNTMLVRFDPETQNPLRDERGRCIACKPGEVGELLGRINSRLVSQRFDGYADASATEKKILRDVKKPGDAWFRSGDLLKKDSRGYYYFVDRVGDTFRWKGENVSTNEVGAALQRFPGVEIANVYGVSLPHADGRAGMATLVFNNGSTIDAKALFGHVVRELPHYAQPAFVRVADKVALTATLKLKKADLVNEGYDPVTVKDALFYRDDAAGAYSPLDAGVYEQIQQGHVRF